MKQKLFGKRCIVLSRPFTGAWIETVTVILSASNTASPLHGGVD